MPLPQNLTVGPLVYTVEEIADLRHEGVPIFGEINPTRKVCYITIERDMPMQRKQVTLWHELIHAILNHAQRSDVSDEVVGVLAFGIVDLLKDNPWLREGRE